MFFVLIACAQFESGVVTVVVEGVEGAEGLLLITDARDADDNQAGVACVSIDADPFGASFPMRELGGDSPCDESPTATLSGGEYTLSAGVVAGGETEASQCAEASITVDGDITVTLPALGTCG